ncbi:hypothetical protein L209DRAFT_613094 [Thermothelomyces heterothallicus CBS 203.75]
MHGCFHEKEKKIQCSSPRFSAAEPSYIDCSTGKKRNEICVKTNVASRTKTLSQAFLPGFRFPLIQFLRDIEYLGLFRCVESLQDSPVAQFVMRSWRWSNVLSMFCGRSRFGVPAYNIAILCVGRCCSLSVLLPRRPQEGGSLLRLFAAVRAPPNRIVQRSVMVVVKCWSTKERGCRQTCGCVAT